VDFHALGSFNAYRQLAELLLTAYSTTFPTPMWSRLDSYFYYQWFFFDPDAKLTHVIDPYNRCAGMTWFSECRCFMWGHYRNQLIFCAWHVQSLRSRIRLVALERLTTLEFLTQRLAATQFYSSNLFGFIRTPPFTS